MEEIDPKVVEDLVNLSKLLKEVSEILGLPFDDVVDCLQQLAKKREETESNE